MQQPDRFDTFIRKAIDSFLFGFNEESTSLFVGDNGLIHPGEFGEYRERVCIDLIRHFIPQRLDIGTGFIINSFNDISNQCDIVIYDKENSMSLEDPLHQRFFPVETVAAIGEVKSTLSKTELLTALDKLIKIKQMREKIKSPSYVYRTSYLDFCPSISPNDQIGTFLVCKKIKVDADDLPELLDEFYKNYPISYRNNLILDIDNGIFVHRSEAGNSPFPYMGNIMYQPFYYKAEEDKHIRIFINLIKLLIQNTSILYTELGDYLHLNDSLDKTYMG